MCHIIIALPFVSLILFALLPFWQALSVYAFILLVCGILFWLVGKDMMRPATTGIEGMMGGVGHVAQIGTGPAKISCKGEIWDAVPGEKLSEGDTVEIRGIDRMKLIVRHTETG